MTDPAIKAGRRHSASDDAIIKALRADMKAYALKQMSDADDFAGKMSDYLKALGYEDEDGDGEVTPDEAEAQAVEEDEAPATKALDLASRCELVCAAVRDALDEVGVWDEEEDDDALGEMAERVRQVGADYKSHAANELVTLVYDKEAIAMVGPASWRIPYTIEGGEVVLATPDAWTRVEAEWKPVPGAAPITEAKYAIKAIVTDEGDEVLAYPGESVKAMGEGLVGGYLVRFGGTGDLSQWRDIFTPHTDFGSATKTDVWVHHRMLPGLGKRRLSNQAEIGLDDVGVFIKHLLDMRDPYEAALYRAADARKMGWSSGTAPHLVERKAIGDGRHEVTLWPLGLDASYTPTPAGGLGVTTKALKTTLAALGLSIDDPSPEVEPAPSPERRASAEGATAAAAQRLALELDLLTLETNP